MDAAGRDIVVLIFIDDVLADAHTFVADEDRFPCDQFLNFVLTGVTERTAQSFVSVFLHHARFEMTSSKYHNPWTELQS